ncbi:MAG: TonB-dependent receptor [Opitutaceae bacterium]
MSTSCQSMKHRRTRRFLLFLGLTCGLWAQLQAQDTAVLGGRVSAASDGLPLEGVQVTIDRLSQSASTGRGGRYQLSGLPTGTVRVLFNYVGLAEVSREVALRAGDNRLDVAMEWEVFELDAFVVEGSAIGQARALNLQRSADTLSTIVSADAIGRFPDQNAAEALSRLPGISVERDQGEGRFVVVRGIDPNLNSVALDGVKLASPSAGERATLLDTIPTDTLQSIEVFKSTLPSQSGDSVGGYINIRTPSAFDDDARILRFGIQGNYSDLAGDWRGKVNGAFGQQFNEGKVGFMINASYEEREFGSDNKEADPWTVEEGGDGSSGYISEAIQFREYDLVRTRTGISANLEFKPSPEAYYFLRGSWNEYEDTEIRHRMILEDLEDFREIENDTFIADTAVAVREMKDRTENMRIMAASIGGENQIGQLKVDYRLSYSKAEEDTPFDLETVYEFTEDVGLRFTGTSGDLPAHEQLTGPSLTDPDNYDFDGVELASQLVGETDISGDVKLTYDFNQPTLRSVSFGGLFRTKEKTSDLEVFKNDDNPSQVDTLSGFVYANPRDTYRSGLPYISPDFSTFFRDNRAAFAMERDEVDSILEDFRSDEDVAAGFAMATLDLAGWQLIAGVRVENTRFKTSGYSFNDDRGDIFTVSASRDYTDVLPGLHLRKDFGADSVLRFSVNKTLSRPNFEQTIPNAEIEGDEVTVGNPLLDPLESFNVDLSFERYLRPLGLFSAAVFYKEIDNFIYEQVINGTFPGVGDAEITTFRNGPSGSILGLELAYQRQLNFLPAAFDGMSFYSNLTLVDSEADVLGPEEGDPTREVPFIKQSDWIANIALTYEKHGIFARLAYSYRDDYLDEVGEESIEDRYISNFGQLDLSLAYTVNQNVTVFANWVNITNEPLRANWDVSGRLSQFEEYGWSVNAGLKLVF